MEDGKLIERVRLVYVHGATVDRPRSLQIWWGFERPEEVRIDGGSRARVNERGSARATDAVARDSDRTRKSIHPRQEVVITVGLYGNGYRHIVYS